MARPTLFDDERVAKILKVIRNGGSRESAAAAAGITYAVLRKWIQRGRAGDEQFVAFVAAVKAADGAAEQAMVRLVRKAARTSWQAAAWWLERRRGKRYALKRDMKVEMTMSPEQARAKYRELTGKEWGE